MLRQIWEDGTVEAARGARRRVRLGLPHPLAQRLAVDAEITGDVGDRTTARLEVEPHGPLAQLGWSPSQSPAWTSSPTPCSRSTRGTSAAASCAISARSPSSRAFVHRWQIAKLLDEQHSYLDVAERVHASTTTVTRVSHWLHHGAGGYRVALDRTRRRAKAG